MTWCHPTHPPRPASTSQEAAEHLEEKHSELESRSRSATVQGEESAVLQAGVARAEARAAALQDELATKTAVSGGGGGGGGGGGALGGEPVLDGSGHLLNTVAGDTPCS